MEAPNAAVAAVAVEQPSTPDSPVFKAPLCPHYPTVAIHAPPPSAPIQHHHFPVQNGRTCSAEKRECPVWKLIMLLLWLVLLLNRPRTPDAPALCCTPCTAAATAAAPLLPFKAAHRAGSACWQERCALLLITSLSRDMLRLRCCFRLLLLAGVSDSVFSTCCCCFRSEAVYGQVAAEDDF